MKTKLHFLFLLPALIAGLGVIPAGPAEAQTFTTVYAFSDNNTFRLPFSGANPYAGLILSTNGLVLYGTTTIGGIYMGGVGVLFSLAGTNFTPDQTFFPPEDQTNTDGANPRGALALSGNTLYGTAVNGGGSGKGEVFAAGALPGSAIAPVHYFAATSGPNSTNSDGANPYCGLILSGSTLYGTAVNGGGSGYGTIFSVNTNSAGFTTLYSFTNGTDGANPYAGLILSNNTLYGTAKSGGLYGSGTVFSLSTNGTNFATVYSFTATSGPNFTNSDGANPYGGLVLAGNTLYGTAEAGGSSGLGTVFSVSTNGTNFMTLHSFTATSGASATNSDGANPYAGLALSGNTLYGAAEAGGSGGVGTLYAVTTGGAFTPLYSFTAVAAGSGDNADGAFPYGTLVESSNVLFGTAYAGGPYDIGTVFGFTLPPVPGGPPPALTIAQSGTNAILTWPTNATGFTLQSATNLGLSEVWAAVSPAPVVVTTNNAVTNAISGTQLFYRLMSP